MILVTGATGNVGGALVRQLQQAGCNVRALVRGEGRAGPPGVEVASGDLDRPDSLTAALKGVRALFLLGGARDMPALMREVRRAGVDHVALLTSRSVVGGSPTNAIVALWSASEDAVRSSGVPWTILRPSGFMSNALRWVPQVRAGDLVRAPFPDVSIAAIDPFDIAAVAAEVLGSGLHLGRSHELSGPAGLTPAEQVRILGAALGRRLRFEGIAGAEVEEQPLTSRCRSHRRVCICGHGGVALESEFTRFQVAPEARRARRGIGECNVSVRSQQIARVTRQPGARRFTVPRELVEREARRCARAGQLTCGAPVDVDLPLERRERDEVVPQRRGNPRQAIASVDPAGLPFAETRRPD